MSTSLKESLLWGSVKSYLLKENMQARGSEPSLEFGNRIFADWLLTLGDDELPKDQTLEDHITCATSMVIKDRDV